MTLDDLAALEREATKGEWKYTAKVEEYAGEGTYLVEAGSDWLLSNCRYYNTAPQRNEDAAFIAAIRNAAPILIEVARAAKRFSVAYHTKGDIPWIMDESIENALSDALARLEGVRK